MSRDNTFVLAVESAICGGSVSLIGEGREIANWIGSDSVSRAEDLLPDIDKLLVANNISRKEVGLIAVSAGPGSFTGIRIGIATALGLSRSLDAELSSVSVLKAMVFACESGPYPVAAVPVGRNAVCIQSFQKRDDEIATLNEPQTIREDAFLDTLQTKNGKTLVLHASLYKKASASSAIINSGENLAFAVGLMCIHQPSVRQIRPLSIGKSF